MVLWVELRETKSTSLLSECSEASFASKEHH